jgi:hypothetical protein
MGHRMANCPKLEKQRMKVLTGGTVTGPEFLQKPEELNK